MNNLAYDITDPLKNLWMALGLIGLEIEASNLHVLTKPINARIMDLDRSIGNILLALGVLRMQKEGKLSNVVQQNDGYDKEREYLAKNILNKVWN